MLHDIRFQTRAGSARRGGAALILAMVILLMLLMLGLPFVMSQSVSLSGSIHNETNHHAHSALATAESQAIQIAADVSSLYFIEKTPTAEPLHNSSRLIEDLVNPNVFPTSLVYPAVSSNDLFSSPELLEHRVHLARRLVPVPNSFPSGEKVAIDVSASLMDESGKIDVNRLTAEGWFKVLIAVLGPGSDWDDGSNGPPFDSEGAHDPVGDYLNNGTIDDDGGGTEFNDDDDDDDNIGELSEALANKRFDLPGNRYSSLEQLLEANPGHNTDDVDEFLSASPPIYEFGVNNDEFPAGYKLGFRHPLTASELETLRPYLTVHSTAQARDGRTELGTVIAHHRSTPTSALKLILDSDVSDLISNQSVLFGADVDINTGDKRELNWRLPRNSIDISQTDVGGSEATPLAASVLYPIWVEAPSLMNILAMPRPLRLAFFEKDVTYTSTDKYLDLKEATPYPAAYTDTGNTVQDTNLFEMLYPFRRGTNDVLFGLNSWGLYETLTGAASYHQASNTSIKPGSSFSRRRVMQVMPQEEEIFRGWNSQMDFWLLARHLCFSNMSTWPHAVNRVSGIYPNEDIGLLDATDHSGLSLRVSTSPATAAETYSRQPRDWSRQFRGNTTNFLETGDNPSAPDSLLPPEDMTPDGIALKNSVLAYTNNGDANSAWPVTGEMGELDGRQWDFWLKLRNDGTDWAASEHVLMELSGKNPSASMRDRWRLLYDGPRQCLIVECVNGAQSPSEYGHKIPMDDLSDATAYTNESSLGSTATSAKVDLSPSVPIGGQYTRYVYSLGEVGDHPGMEPGRWYHIQLAIAHSGVGGTTIIVDQLVGRDVTKNSPSEKLRPGDHSTLPQLILAQDLPAVNGTTDGGNAVSVQQIQLRGNPIANLFKESGKSISESLLPERGAIRVGDEYIIYEEIDGDTLRNCQRGRGQNTEQRPLDQTNSVCWPTLAAHFEGSSVLQAGYRFRLGSTERLFGGGGVLAHDFHNGDPLHPIHRWRHWGYLSINPLDYGGSLNVNKALNSLKVQASNSYVANIPPRGVISISKAGTGSMYALYKSFNIGENKFEGLVWLDNTTCDIDDLKQVTDISFTVSDPPLLMVVGLELSNDPGKLIGDLSDENFWHPTSYLDGTVQKPFSADLTLVQTLDLSTGRCEWLNYDHLGTVTDPITKIQYHFIIDNDGFYEDSRGRQRTAFAGTYKALSGSDDLPPATYFPGSSLVVPVQTSIDRNGIGIGAGRYLQTGDTVTLMPHQLNNGIPDRRVTMRVRYAAHDHYPNAVGSLPPISVAPPPLDDWPSTWDVKDQWFAFDRPIGFQVDSSAGYDLVCNNAWTVDDQSPKDQIGSHKSGLMPRLAAMADNLDVINTPPSITFGNQTAGSQHIDLDAVMSGMLFGSTISAAIKGEISTVAHTDSGSGLISDSEIDFDITHSSGYKPSNNRYGLIKIGEEVMAYHTRARPPASAFNLTIIARGLLGSDPTPMDLLEDNGKSAIFLPIGPVGTLVNTPLLVGSPAGTAVDIDYGSEKDAFLAAPAFLLTSVSESAYELASFVNTPQNDTVLTAPWLRGLYNTTPKDFAVGDLIIPYWPRYASAFPNTDHTEVANSLLHKAAQMRCRKFAWAGFPVGFKQMLFGDGVNDVPAEIVNLRGSPVHDMFAVALTGANALEDIDSSDVVQESDIKTVFNVPMFQTTRDGDIVPRFVNDAELRVFWRYNDAVTSNTYSQGTSWEFFTKTAKYANTPVGLEEAYLRFKAGTVDLTSKPGGAGATDRTLDPDITIGAELDSSAPYVNDPSIP